MSLNRQMLKLGYDGQVSFSEADLLLLEQLHAVRLACLRDKCTQAFASSRRENRGVVSAPLSFCLTHPHPSSLPLSLTLAPSCLTPWSAGNKLGEAVRVNGLKVSAGRLRRCREVISKGHRSLLLHHFKLGTHHFKPSYYPDFTVKTEFRDHCESALVRAGGESN